MTPEDTQDQRSKSPPTMSPVTFANFCETHRRTLPSRIDRSLMKSNSGSDQPRILSGLQFMGLTEPSGKPTPKFERLRDVEGDDLKSAWATIIMEAYPSLFADFDLTRATQAQIEERFREEYGITGDSVRKAVAFFLALARSAGVELSPHAKPTRIRSSSGRSTGGAKRARLSRSRASGSAEPSSGDEREPSRLHPAVQAWIDEMPANGEPWDANDFDEWLQIFRSSIKRAYKIGEGV